MHYTEQYFLNPQHPVTISLVGCGGTGSQVLTNLARMDHALRGIGHPGFYVFAYDPDEVSEANIGRQLFSPGEVGLNKAVVLVSRINRFFGLGWSAVDKPFLKAAKYSNIIITCVDTAKARVEIDENFSSYQDIQSQSWNGRPYEKPFYWMDFGNSQKSGQAVLGSWAPIKQPNNDWTNNTKLPTVIDIFPDIENHDNENQGPSCSLAEALSRQDLFVNSILANLGCDLLWKMFREGGIKYHGIFVNLETMKVNPIPVKGGDA